MIIKILLHDRPKIAKVIYIFSFILILFNLYIIAQNPGVRGYEISIYEEYPIYFWYIIIFSIFIFQVSIFLNIFFETTSYIPWKAAFIGIVLSNSIIVLLPLTRRYAMLGAGDPLTHMGYMLDIQNTGHIGDNSYPIAHILGVISHEFSGFNINISILIYPFIFYIIFILSIYLIYRIVLDSRASIFIGMMLAPLLFFGNGNVLFFPQGLSNYYLPFVIFLFLMHHRARANSVNYALLIVIVSIFTTFFHPLSSLFLIFVFGSYDLSRHIVKSLNSNSELSNAKSTNLILIIIVIFFTWQTYAYILLNTFEAVFDWFYRDLGDPTRFEYYSEQISEIEPDLFTIIKSFIFSPDLYGLRLSFILIGVISIFIMLKAWKNNRLYMNEFKLMFSIGFAVFSSIYIFSQFIIYDVSYVRLVHYAVIFSIILTSMALGDLMKRRKLLIPHAKILCILFIILLIFIPYISVFSVHTSPIIKSVGQHVTDSQLTGMNTFFEKRSEALPIMNGGIVTSRFKDALYGHSKKLNNTNYYLEIPYHFNYTSLFYFGDYYSEPVYLIVSELFRRQYPSIIPEYPEKWRFNQADFLMLENDKSVSKTYSNRGIDIYLLNPISKKDFSGS